MNKLQSHIDKIGWQFDNTYSKLPDNMFSKLGPIPVKAPEVVVFNHSLSKEMGLDFSNAKDFLLNFSSSKTNDGPVSTYFNRRISKWITSKLVYYPVTPNQISVITFLITVIASLIIVKQGYFFLC